MPIITKRDNERKQVEEANGLKLVKKEHLSSWKGLNK